MSEVSRPNFYELLEIDPSQPWSDGEFSKILKIKQGEWTKKTKNPKYKVEYTGYLQMVKLIEQIMKDPKSREQERKQTLESQSKQAQIFKQQFEGDLKGIVAKGYILESEVKNLITKFSSVFSESEIRRQISNLGIEIKTKEEADNPENIKINNIDKTKIGEIENNLKSLNQQDLYNFLGLPKTTRTDELCAAASNRYEEIKKTGQSTAEASAIMALAGHAKTFFKDDEKRKIYDFSLSLQVFQSLEDAIDNITLHEKIIYGKQFTYLLELAFSRGIDVEKAKKHIITYGRNKKIAVEMAGVEAVKQKIACPQCQTINERDQDFCSNCGSSLKIKCPSCGLISSIEDRACSKCSFPIGNESIVRRYLVESQKLIHQKFYEDAVNHLNLTQQAWSSPLISQTLNDDLSKQISQLKSEAEQKKQNLINCQQQLNHAINERLYYEARRILQQLKLEFASLDLNREESKIEAEIHKAESELEKVRQLETQGEDAIDLYQKVLSICKDCQAAKDALAKTPPLPASQLSANKSHKIINLSWQASPSKKVGYTIIRKYHSQPISSKDGEQLDTIFSTSYDDNTVESGKPVYYAIYTNREGVLAVNSAQLEQPILLTSEVSNLVAQAMDTQVNLTWTHPQNVTEIQIYRSTQPFNTSNQGERVEVINISNVIDKNLENGKKYYYLIYSLFKNYDGSLIKSQGITIDVIPEKPPSPLEDLTIEVIKTDPYYQLKLSWQLPTKGEGAVLQSDSFPDFGKTHLLPQGSLSEYGKVLQETNTSVTITIEKKGIFYFTPILLFQKNAYLGKTREYVNVDDVSNLKCQKQTNEIQVRWNWPENCQEIILSHGERQFPSSHKDSNATHIKVTKNQYNLKGYYPITSITNRDYFIVVYAVFNKAGQTLIASGLNESARVRISLSTLMKINYEISREKKGFGLFKGKLLLIININGKGQMPDLVLVYKQGGKPIKKTDGETALTISSTILQEDKTTFTYELKEQNRCYGSLFIANDSLYESKGGYVRINKPEIDKLEMF